MNDLEIDLAKRQTDLIAIAIVYGLNAIATAINPETAESSRKLASRVFDLNRYRERTI